MLFSTILCLALGLVARADFPLEYAEPADRSTDTSYRLPDDFSPIHYDVEVTPYFVQEGLNEAFTFDGRVKIEVVANKANLASITVQANVKRINSVTITDKNGVPLRLNPFTPFSEINQYHFLKVNLADGVTFVEKDTYFLTVDYIGNINETPLSRGVFRGNYKDESGTVRWYLATHLQPTHSRQAFPSFDEPGFKSSFTIIINRPEHFADSFSNMRLKSKGAPINNRVKETFEDTPIMSAYLVTFHVSETFTVIADNEDHLQSYRILARPEAKGQGEYALEVGPPLTKWLSDYFSIDYYSMKDNIKNDQIASPYWASGATENWGLVTYREVRLLYDKDQTNALDKMYIGTITAHELAHKWFGNLITCKWWDNVWINEGFASYFEYFAMDEVDKKLELADQFNLMYIQSALSTDSSASTRALEHAVNSPTEVTGHFTGISYSKGATLLLMLKHLVQENTFKKALNRFLLAKSNQHALPSDLFDAFKQALDEDKTIDVDIYAFMKYWVEQPGYPVLNVNVNTDSGAIHVNQERFFISPTATPTDQVWPLPLTFTTGSSPNWSFDVESVLTGKTHQLEKSPGEEWVIFNVGQQNMYRVNYNIKNWQLLAAALNEDHTKIHHLNRAQIVDDVFALTRSVRMSYTLGFQVLEFLKKDTSYYSWYPAVTGFNWLRNRFLHIPAVLDEFDKIIFEHLEAVIEDLGYNVVDDEPLTKTLNRFFTMSFACNIGHEGCVADAVQKFNNLVQNGASVNPNIRRHVYCEGLRAGGLAEWQFLRNLYDISNNQADQVVMLRALGCTTNDQARQNYLNMILNDDVVKHQDRLNAFSFLLMGHRSNAKVALDFLKANVNRIREGVVLPAWFNSVISNIASYLDEEGLQDMEQWLEENKDTFPEYSVGISSINSARANMKWGTDNAQGVLGAAQGSASVALPTTMILLWSLLAILLK